MEGEESMEEKGQNGLDAGNCSVEQLHHMWELDIGILHFNSQKKLWTNSMS